MNSKERTMIDSVTPKAGAGVLLINRCNDSSRKLEAFLDRYYGRGIRKSNLEEILKCPFDRDGIHLIVIADPGGTNADHDFLEKLKRLFLNAKFICLFDRVTEEKEISLRSSGLVFLGSFKHFFKFAADILNSAFA
ncbi:MAG: hypothetical protein V2B19_14620 [Pseudomonadota bacterium]